MKNKWATLIGVALAGCLLYPATAYGEPLSSPTPNRESSGNPIKIDLYNLTDIHGHIEQATNKEGKVIESGLTAMSCMIANGRAKNPDSQFVLLGDNIGASPFTSGIAHDNPTIEALNAMQPLASTLGNHELDMGQQVFKDRVDGKNGFVKLGFPYLAASVEGLGNYLKPYVIWESPGGVKIAFIGGIGQDVPNKVDKGLADGLTFNDPVKTVNGLAKELKAQKKADVVVAMIDDDVKNTYPQMNSSVDALMGGDTHVWYGFDMVNGAQGNKLSATASGAYTDNLSKLVLEVDPQTKKVIKSHVERYTAADVAKCVPEGEGPSRTVNTVKDIVERAIKNAKSEKEAVIADGVKSQFSRGVFQASVNKAPAPGSNRGIESSLGNMIADAFKETASTSDRKVDIGLMVAGAIREELVPKDGKLTYGDVFAVMPFSDKTAVNKISGANLKLALEQQWKELSEQNSRPMLKLSLSSNVQYTYDVTKPFGSRITSLLIDGKPVKPKQMYTIASVKFLLEGGDGFTALAKDSEPVALNNPKMPMDRDYIVKYLHDNPNVLPRKAKSAIGVSMPTEAKDGEKITINLRGLSYSEGPSITKKVTVHLGEESAQADVDNSLLELNANNAKSIITTDGAGQAKIIVPVKANCAEHPGEKVFLPLSLSTDFAEVVSPAQKLGVTVQCEGKTGSNVLPEDTARDSLNNDARSNIDKEEKASNQLANTGTGGGALILFSLATVVIGAGVHKIRRGIIKHR